MSDCTCKYSYSPRTCGKTTYRRRTTGMPHTGWYIKAEKPSLFSYVTNGSYTGRNKR